MTDKTECISPMPVASMPELDIRASDTEILLSVDKCFSYKLVEFAGQVIKEPVAISIHETVDEIRKIIPLVTIEETGAMLRYKDGVYVQGGEAKLEALLHTSFHGFEPFDPEIMPKKVIAHLKGLTMVSKDKFDDNLDIINMKNGLYNWREKILYRHSPNYLSLIQIPVKYDPDAKCTRIETVLTRVMSAKDIRELRFSLS
jgi:hypothetical protein